MKKWVILVFVILFGTNFGIWEANAEGGFKAEKFEYKEMQIQIMPEFDYPENWPKDEPSLLVGYYGTVINKSGTDFNGTIELPLPMKDKDFSVYLVAEFPDANKPEVQRPYKLDRNKGVLTWDPGTAIKKDEEYRFVVEYYVNPFSMKGADKSFSFQYTPQAETEKLDVIIYNPLNAKDFNIEPKTQNISKSEYGQELYHYQYTNAEKGKPLKYTASYKKEGNESSLSIISKMNPPSDENHGETATKQVAKNNGERPLINTSGAIIIGVSIIIAGIFIFLGLTFGRKSAPRKSVQKKSVKNHGSREKKAAGNAASEKKKLRIQLLNGKIDQKTYEEKIKKLM